MPGTSGGVHLRERQRDEIAADLQRSTSLSPVPVSSLVTGPRLRRGRAEPEDADADADADEEKM
ncbi:hypothetical protein GCM10010517_23150 [Streptosporangium fragile]|uniref:Uncharacterized protein n=1 Tax=Streptosporangium fragile TaxID=46186 RepID=A0ABN3VUG1_9ACTN